MAIFGISNYSLRKAVNSPYPKNADRETVEKWIDDQIYYYEKVWNRKVISVTEDYDSIDFIFEMDPNSHDRQTHCVSHSKR